MSSDNALSCSNDAVYGTGRVTLTSDGFSVGSEDHVNYSGATFYWMAFKAGPHIDIGSYVGDGEITQDITTGRQPNQVLVIRPTGTEQIWWKGSCMGTNDAATYATAYAFSIAAMAVISTGFTVGPALNANGVTFYYVAMYYDGKSTQHHECGSYSGSGGSGQTITLGYQPSYLMIFDNAGDFAGFKTSGVPTDYAGKLSGSYVFDDGQFTITSTGFTIDGTGDFDTSGVDYYYLVGRY
jgi:hypothetical protein